jgi:5'-nucleotidase
VSVVPDVPRAQFKEILENAVSSAPAADGRFAQVAGFSFSYDPSLPAQEVDNDGNVLTPGERVRSVTLDDGTVLVEDGQVVDGDPVAVATNDFSARGGDQYPFRGAPFTTVGVTYQQALADYLVDQLAGVVSAADYPEGGTGRITAL